MPVLVLLVQVLQGLGPELLGQVVPELLEQALVALLGPEPVRAVLLLSLIHI